MKPDAPSVLNDLSRMCSRRLLETNEGVAVSLQSTTPMPGIDPHLPRTATRSVRESKRLQGVAGDIMAAARLLYERDGVARTSLAAIAREAGVTRTLLYYYFDGKEAVTAAVIDDYLEDIIESVSMWNELRDFGNTPNELRKCVAAFRRTLYTASGEPRPMFAVLEELGVRDAFATRAVQETVECIYRNIVAEYTMYRSIDIDLVPETFALVLYGVVGLMKAKPNITDEELAILIAQTLRLDMWVLESPPWRENPLEA